MKNTPYSDARVDLVNSWITEPPPGWAWEREARIQSVLLYANMLETEADAESNTDASRAEWLRKQSQYLRVIGESWAKQPGLVRGASA